MKIFLAHPKEYSRLDELYDCLLPIVHAISPSAVLVNAADDYARNFARFGSWDAWIDSVVGGREYVNGEIVPRFTTLIVAPNRRIGKATAAMVKAAPMHGKLVYFFDFENPSERRIEPIHGVVLMDPEDFTHGWTVY